MGWLIGPTLASFFAAFIAIKLFDYIFASVSNGAVSATRAGVFVATWTAVTTMTGMRGFRKRVRQIRERNVAAIKALAKGERP